MCVLFMILQLYNRSFIERLDTQLSKNLIQFIFQNKGTPQDPYLKKTVKSTGSLKFLILSDPLNPILKKKLILGQEIGFEIA